jgi:hypothetical protein
MDCPHCGVENLLGAKACFACGGAMLGAPPPRAPEPPTEREAPRADAASASTVICRVCMEGFEGRPGDEMAICPLCRGFETGGGGASERRTTAPDPASVSSLGTAPDPKRRPKPVERRAGLRAGPIVAIVGLLVGLATMGVVSYARREHDPTEEYLASLQPEPAAFAFAPSKDGYVRLETTLSLGIRYERLRANFSDGMDTALELRQKSVQTLDVAFSNDDDRGAVFDTVATCRVTQQSGTSGGSDIRDARLYPWTCADRRSRVVVPADGPTRNAEGVVAVPGADVLPFFTVRDVAAPAGDAGPGAKWKAVVTLPLAATRDGVLTPAPFQCDFNYAGRIVRNGFATLLVSVKGTRLESPGDVVDDMNRASAAFEGVIFFDAKTGLVHEAHLTGVVALWEEHGRVEDRVIVNATLDVARK